jgi:hypothetical protein
MREYLNGLRGQALPTIVTGAPNTVLYVTSSSVMVGTESNPNGAPVSISFIQREVDRIFDGEEIIFDQHRRSAFLGAVLATMGEVELTTNPRRARLKW